MAEFAIFMGTLAVANLLPGPDMVMLVSTAAARGRRQALAAALGLGLARACHVMLAAVGLAQLLQASPVVFEAVKLAGAAYLVWIGLSVALSPVAGRGRTAPALAHAPVGRSFGRGFLTNITNPKALIFLSVVLPQSIHPEAGAVYAQFALLGSIAVATAFLFDLAYIALATRAARLAPQNPRLARLQRLGMGSLLIAFSARLAFA